MDMMDRLLELYAHMEWADAITWTSVLKCDAALSDDPVRARLHHLHMVQRAFSNIWRNVPHTSGAGRDLSLQQLLPWAREYHTTVQDYLKTVDSARLDAELVVPWAASISKMLGRDATPTTLGETILQAVLHSTYHRGQIATRLKELGGQPQLSDYIVWLWSGKPAAAWPENT